jgi:GMP synthase (glutamine-hydrolysing)
MKPILVLQHVPHETLGTLESYFVDAGFPCHYVGLFSQVPERLDLDEAAGLVILGGPMNVDEVDQYPFLRSDVIWIREAIDREIPVLGICLGAQLLAKSQGARVYRNPVKEIGWYEIELTHEAAEDPLFAGLAPRQTVFQWHADTFDLPPGAVLLARGQSCRHQAFRVGRSAYGLQFHAEMTASLVEEWLSDEENRHELATLDYIDPERIRAETPEFLARMAALGRHVLPRFVVFCRHHRQ